MTTIALICLIAGLGIFLIFWLIDGFDFEETTDRWYADIAGIAGLLGGIYFIIKWIIHGIVWLAKGIWAVLSSPIFWIIIGSIAFVYAIVKLTIYLRKRYLNKIYTAAENNIREQLEIPITHGAVNRKNYQYCIQTTNHLLALKKQLEENYNELSRADLKKRYFDEKLLLFYNVSMDYESINEEAYSEFKKRSETSVKTGNYSLLRTDMNEKIILESRIPMYSEELAKIKKDLDENRMNEIADNWNLAKDKETIAWHGFWTSKRKMEDKTRLMKELYDASVFEYEELKVLSKKINYILGHSRLCAFRNIYLGLELVNYIRPNSGGKNLKTQSGDLISSTTGPTNINFSNSDISTNFSIIDSISSYTDSALDFISDKDNFELVYNNPKIAAGTAAIGLALNVIGDWLEKHDQIIENQNKIQNEIIDHFEKLSDAYLASQSQLYRAIEIIKAIVNANKGFLSIYVPLRDRVFGQRGSLSILDIQKLALATQEYKKISDSTLN